MEIFIVETELKIVHNANYYDRITRLSLLNNKKINKLLFLITALCLTFFFSRPTIPLIMPAHLNMNSQSPNEIFPFFYQT